MSSIIYNHELSNKKFDILTLEKNIDNLSLKKLLNTQILTLEFCEKYLLNPEKYGMCIEDDYITMEDILRYQPHLNDKLYNLKM